MTTLRQTLVAGGILIGRNTRTKDYQEDLEPLLQSRLSKCSESLGLTSNELPSALDVRRKTGFVALLTIERINAFLLKLITTKIDDKPALGSRDLVIIRTLLSLIFRWTSQPLLEHLYSVWPSKQTPDIGLAVTSTTEEVVISLVGVVKRLLSLLVSIEDDSKLNFTSISVILIDKHFSDLLEPALATGWLPKLLLPGTSVSGFADIRVFTMRVLQLVQPPSALSALGTIISSPKPTHITKTASFLMGKQLLRPNGVRGLCAALFGETSSDLDLDETTSLERMDWMARILSASPNQMKPDAYFSVIIPNSLTILKSAMSSKERIPPLAHLRAIAFTISKFLTEVASVDTAGRLTLAILHRPWTHPARDDDFNSRVKQFCALETLEIISAIITNTYPSQALISTLLSPIIASIYALFVYLKPQRASDPTLLELCKSLFVTWAKITEVEEAREVLWNVIQGQGGIWSVEGGELQWINQNSSLPTALPLSVNQSTDAMATPFNLKPAPSLFVEILEETDRGDLMSELFIKALDTYLGLRRQNNDPLRQLALLQIVSQMQSRLAGMQKPANIFSRPQQILSLIFNALEDEKSDRTTEDGVHKIGMNLDSLRIVQGAEEEEDSDKDSDDGEALQDDTTLPSDIANTAVTLLLSLLEVHPDLSMANEPILDKIWDQLQFLARREDRSLAALAREARLVLSARFATGSDPLEGKNVVAARVAERKKYQKALKLLQDPILPVRAHGLILLKEIVSPPPGPIVGAPTRATIDSALIPAIMSIFLESVQVDESYIFLNAVQGLSALASHAGRETLRNILAIYTKGFERRPVDRLTRKEIDTRLRIGEALKQVIDQLNEVLPAYSDLLIPTLFDVIGERDAPVLLRISTVSLLAHCVNVNFQSVSTHYSRIVDSMLDLLQIESLHAQNQLRDSKSSIVTPDEDSQTTDAKVAEFRRAALHLLGMLIREPISDKYSREEKASRSIFNAPRISLQNSLPMINSDHSLNQETIGRMSSVLGYIASTDVDSIVRFMAKETFEMMHSD